ncbi:MAG: LeuA family protein [Candidatus Krumholzibacteria bacterium]|nr:LeuA family protein [Candidatus Krumholzibacteria bacterium]
MKHDSGELDERTLIYDWNTVDEEPDRHIVPAELDDETLRDGLQSPSVTDPPTAQKVELLHLMVDLGIHAADIGLPGAGPRALADVIALAKEIATHKLPIEPNCAARTLKTDIDPIIEASHKAGFAIEASVFIGSSPIREYVENWTLDQMLRHTEEAVTYAMKNGLSVMFVTEDTTRAQPDALQKLYGTAIRCGARRICVADTVGHATPRGTMALIRHIRKVVEGTGEKVKIDWHGHSDRGLSVANSLAAIEAGADRVHGTGLGVGERCGNAPMEQLLVNLRLLGYIDSDLSKLDTYCALVSEACGAPIPISQPIVGPDAFRTATGVHAAAVVKAMKKGHSWLANRVYSGVPAEWVGRKQTIEIGPMSGASNVIYWLEMNGVEPEDELVQRILGAAKQQTRRLTRDEIEAIIGHSMNN